jgi:hypothetical protein
MASFLKRLLNNRQEGDDDSLPVAQDDWSPVPVSAAAQAPNVLGWLQEERVLTPHHSTEKVRPRRRTIQRMYKRIAGLIAPEEEHLTIASTAEEQATALPSACSALNSRENDPTLPWRRTTSADLHHGPSSLPVRSSASVDSHHTSPTLAQPSSSSSTIHDKRSVVNQVATRVGEDASPHGTGGKDFARREGAKPRRAWSGATKDWVEVLKQYGEHLTEEELKIVKKQLA